MHLYGGELSWRELSGLFVKSSLVLVAHNDLGITPAAAAPILSDDSVAQSSIFRGRDAYIDRSLQAVPQEADEK